MCIRDRPYGETWSRWSEAIKQNLEDVGVKVQIENTDVPGWTQKASNWDFDLNFNFLYQLGDPAMGCLLYTSRCV